MKAKKIELLAPAKNSELGITAISHGADAVYIAANRFGAREAAGNSLPDIEKLVKYAHRYYAKVYLVLNTILYDNELDQAQTILAQAYNAGCDAAIIQDMGILEMDIPPIPLFASTQTHNLDINRIKFLESGGFQRIILARELSIQEIAFIKSNTSIDLEAFVHGALCVSYSGQCYISQAITGRSANRGACAQMCRLPYNITDAQGNILVKQKHVLSLKDLNLSEHLSELMAAGVSSFKIEGRLKDLNYVKNITSLYRRNLDAILNKSDDYVRASSGSTYHFFQPDAFKTFSRNYTTYFSHNRINSLASFDSPKSIGEYIGKVGKCGNNFIVLDKPQLLNNGDGICFISSSGEMTGTRVNKVEKDKIYLISLQGIKTGTKIYRNFDHEFTRQLNNSNTASRQIQAMITFKVDATGVVLSVTDEDKNSITINHAYTADIARNADKAADNIKEQLSKSGDSIFQVTGVDIIADNAYFFPLSQLNAWRRESFEQLEQKRINNYIRPVFVIKPNDIPYPETELDYTANVSNHLAGQFYKRHGVIKIDRAFELDPNVNKPVLMFNRYCIKYQMGICPHKQGGKPTGPLFLEYKNKRFKLEFDCVKCEMKIVDK